MQNLYYKADQYRYTSPDLHTCFQAPLTQADYRRVSAYSRYQDRCPCLIAQVFLSAGEVQQIFPVPCRTTSIQVCSPLCTSQKSIITQYIYNYSTNGTIRQSANSLFSPFSPWKSKSVSTHKDKTLHYLSYLIISAGEHSST